MGMLQKIEKISDNDYLTTLDHQIYSKNAVLPAVVFANDKPSKSTWNIKRNVPLISMNVQCRVHVPLIRWRELHQHPGSFRYYIYKAFRTFGNGSYATNFIQ